jgi:anaerobic selenocysteine-containing dehydrogenase
VGGLLFTRPAIDFITRSKSKQRHNRWQSRARKFPEFLGELPQACLSKEIETEGAGQIRLFMMSCGNPVLSITNGKRLVKALEKVDFMVSFDSYLNETSKHADIILPPATGIETAHYDLIFHNNAVRNSAKYSHALFEKAEGAKYDWEVFQ